MQNYILSSEVLMRKLLIFTALLSIVSLISATDVPASAMYGESFLQRANGVNAIYWNPANLANDRDFNRDYSFMCFSGGILNNSFSINLYNDNVGKYLTESDKKDILGELEDAVKLKFKISTLLFATSSRNHGFSIGTNFYAKGKFSKKYFDLLLNGNEYNRVYTFDKSENGVSVLGYTDVTYAYSGLYLKNVLPFIENPESNYKIPEVKVGVSVSALIGLMSMRTHKFDAELIAGDGGLHLDQNIELDKAAGGFGLKSSIGFSSDDIMDNLSVGLAFDNVFGFINWSGSAERNYITANADSVYIEELDDDVIESDNVTEDSEGWTTTLPLVFKFGSLYKINESSNVSFDWKQSTKTTVSTCAKPQISIAGEYIVKDRVPLRLGLSNGDETTAYAFTYSSGYRSNRLEIDFSVTSYDFLFPGNYSKGVETALSLRLLF